MLLCPECYTQVNQAKWLTWIYCNLINTIKHFLQPLWVAVVHTALWESFNSKRVTTLICKFNWVLVHRFLTVFSVFCSIYQLKNLIESMLFGRICLKMGGFHVQKCFFPNTLFSFSVLNVHLIKTLDLDFFQCSFFSVEFFWWNLCV